MAFFQDIPWHAGEEHIQNAMRVPPGHDNPTVPTLSPQLAAHLQIAPLVAIGTLDQSGRPWTTLWGGEQGLARPLGGGIVGIKTAVTVRHDPVIEELVGKEATGEVVREQGEGRMVSGLTIDLETRKRVKMYGRMVAGALLSREDESTDRKETVAEVQLVVKIQQSLGNCPKYLNSKKITPAMSKPELVDDQPFFSQRALDLLEKADMIFLSSSHNSIDMDTNHRGGPPGFVRVASNEESGAVICWPEYSGNRLYQTLGNLQINPVCGICVPDFETGDMLYLTGRTEILIGKDANAYLPRSNLAVKLTISDSRFITQALPFRGEAGQRSPYSPVVRYLASEAQHTQPKESTSQQQAKLLSQVKLTPTISRFRFSMENAATYKAGQYVTLDFSEHLDIGYSHMRDDDPRSLNDDFVRTFTVSSPPGDPPDPVRRLKDDEFEITVRRVGVVTDFLFQQQGSEETDRASRSGGLEVGVKGFGGEFEVQQHDGEVIGFVAAGVGITPLLPSLERLDFSRLILLWTVRVEDLGLVMDVLDQHPDLTKSFRLFITNSVDVQVSAQHMGRLRQMDVVVELRRIKQGDMEETEGGNDVKKYYLCTAMPMRKQLEQWLGNKELVFEDFNF
ncbi:putative oxidoreductase [Hortaea werneckii]|uniref:FAD-binding FR-type domain-containing protein n=1 Tax=Hortaea werneckii TaxID=91943 RepID=A0A3M7ALT8_HORWE|nr:putative oxidoreductase [Hortaea werneckii]KAI7017444.1 putative oxidoreductase [Hortaea werneckii]KAI7669312.1 putative oxidoreductase [Hortaea werneckii]RMY05985.1 hypothetical protein D0867_09844 [Hortaea werneckii]RMY28482.1 hypothetical protein D0866_09383 [Hortaea werneckii]